MIFEHPTCCHGTWGGSYSRCHYDSGGEWAGGISGPYRGPCFQGEQRSRVGNMGHLRRPPGPWCFDSLLIYWLVTDEQFMCVLVACFACFGFGFHRQFWTTPAAPSFLWSANWAVGSGARSGADESSKKGSTGPAFFGCSETLKPSVCNLYYIYIYYIQLILLMAYNHI